MILNYAECNSHVNVVVPSFIECTLVLKGILDISPDTLMHKHQLVFLGTSLEIVHAVIHSDKNDSTAGIPSLINDGHAT